MKNRMLGLLGLGALLVPLGPIHANSLHRQGVDITEAGFTPSYVEVVVGQEVVWRNVTQGDRYIDARVYQGGPSVSFSSGPIPSSTTWEHVFNHAGTCIYFSRDKREMGTVSILP